MTVNSRGKGAAYERLVRNYFRDEFGPHVCSPRAGEAHDRGDIAGVPLWTFQIKCYADQVRAIREGLIDLDIGRRNTATPYGALIVKRRGRTEPAEQLFVMRLGDAVPVIRELSQ